MPVSNLCAACHVDVALFGRNLWGVGEHKIAENYFGLKYSFWIFKSNFRVNVIYKDVHLNEKFIENKPLAEFKFETA